MRKLTGNWYLKRNLIGHTVMVEVEETTTCEFSFDTSPITKRYVKATSEDLALLHKKTNK